MNELDAIRAEFKRFAPSYALEEADAALDKVIELQAQGLARSGLYYIVLVDLVGSTKFMVDYGNEASAERIGYFVRSALGAISRIDLVNTAVFIKELGDAVLLLFQTFPDVLAWQAKLEEELSFAPTMLGGPPIEVRSCVHVGDVLLDGVNPIALAVSQLFKFEKDVPTGELVLTEPAFFGAWPTLGRAYHAFEKHKLVDMEGYPESTTLYRLRRELHGDVSEFLKEGIDDF